MLEDAEKKIRTICLLYSETNEENVMTSLVRFP